MSMIILNQSKNTNIFHHFLINLFENIYNLIQNLDFMFSYSDLWMAVEFLSSIKY